jgi:hypothetical protein
MVESANLEIAAHLRPRLALLCLGPDMASAGQQRDRGSGDQATIHPILL